MRLIWPGSLTPWQLTHAVARTLTIFPCQLAPIHASAPKPLFCRSLLPPRQIGETVANAASDAVSALGAAPPAAPVVVPAPAAAPPPPPDVRDARYTEMGSISPSGMFASRLPAMRRTVVRHPARSFV